MHTSAKELRRSGSDVDERHQQARDDAASRRSFLRGVGLAGVGGTLLATGGGLATVTRLGGIAGAQAEVNDPLLAAYAQGLELAAVTAYENLGPHLPADLRALGAEMGERHAAFAAAFGDLAGDAVQEEGNQVLLGQLDPTFTDLEDAPADEETEAKALKVLKVLENQLVYTHVASMGVLKDASYAALFATVLPVEAQHATVLSHAAGEGPGEWFPTGAFESSILGDGSDPLRGFDTATFVTG